MARLKKQFCPHGHDTFICGRTRSGGCKKCKKIGAKRPIKNPRKRFCIHGHDILVVGRNNFGICNGCRIPVALGLIEPKSRKKNICKNGHDITIVGRTKMRQCMVCRCATQAQYVLKYPEKINKMILLNQTNRSLRVVTWTDWDSVNMFVRKKPKGMTIDHIIPLQGDEISGLHVSWNLQYLTRHNNAVKHNKVDVIEASAWYGKILEEAGLK